MTSLHSSRAYPDTSLAADEGNTNIGSLFMSLESFSRLSQSIVDAAEVADKDGALKAAALVVNSVGVQSVPKRSERTTAFSESVDFLGDAIQAARAAKQVDRKENKATGTEQPKSLAELLVEVQDSAD
jgi:hypothetical protein